MSKSKEADVQPALRQSTATANLPRPPPVFEMAHDYLYRLKHTSHMNNSPLHVYVCGKETCSVLVAHSDGGTLAMSHCECLFYQRTDR